MELSGEVRVAAPRERVWAALDDVDVLRRCIPGCEDLQPSGEHERTAVVAIKVGPVRARFNGRVRLADIRPGEGCTLHFDGQGGAAGMARGSSRVELLTDGDGTLVRYQTQASVAGKLGQVGGRMIDAAARQMADQFFGSFQAELAPPAARPEETEAPEAAEARAMPEVMAAAVASSAPPMPSPTEADAPGHAPVPHPAPRAATPAAPLPVATVGAEFSRVLWFVLGALSTAFGVWLGRTLFS